MTQLRVGNWIRRYKARGLAGLKSGVRGRLSGVGRRLSADQASLMRPPLIDQTPDPWKRNDALWKRRCAQPMNRVRLTCTVGWMRRTQRSRPKPTRSRPRYVGGRSQDGARTASMRGGGDARQGKTPLIRLTAHPVSTQMISGVSTQGTGRFQVVEGPMNADLRMGFCQRLMTSAQRQGSWVFDHVRVHPAQVFQAWLDDHRDDLEVVYRPADSPEWNPDESLKGDVNAGGHRGKPTRDKAQRNSTVRRPMNRRQNKPERVKKYVQHRSIKYAA